MTGNHSGLRANDATTPSARPFVPATVLVELGPDFRTVTVAVEPALDTTVEELLIDTATGRAA